MIVERDLGRLTKYTFDMGGTGDLLSLSPKVPPWENLHELSPQELQITGLVTTDVVVDVLPENGLTNSAVASLTLKPAQDRLVGSADDETIPPAPKSTKTAEAAAPTGAESSFYLSLRPSLWPCTAIDGGVRNASKRSFTTA